MLRSLLLFALQQEPREVEQDMDEESRRRLGLWWGLLGEIGGQLVLDWCLLVEVISEEFS